MNFLKHIDNETLNYCDKALISVSRRNMIDCISYLLEREFDINKEINGRTALLYSFSRGLRNVSIFLLENGAILRQEDVPYVNKKDERLINYLLSTEYSEYFEDCY